MTELIQAPDTDLLLPDIISPEGLDVAECYIANGGDSRVVAHELSIPKEEVDRQLKNPEVKAYINRIFSETGFRNKHRLFGVLDQVINLKLEEMQETGLGSSQDIMDIMKAAHNMKIQEMKMEAELIKAQTAAKPVAGNQTNVQINNMPGASDPGYMNVLDLLTKGK